MRRRMSIWIPLFGSLVLIALFTVLLFSISADTAIQKSKLEDAQKRLTSLEQEQTALKTTLENADSDSFIENYARTHYGYMLPNETRIVITNPEALYGDGETPASQTN